MTSTDQLYSSLSERKRPEDITEIIHSLLDNLSSSEQRILEKAARGSLKNKIFGYTSMLQDFAQPIGAEKQIQKAIKLFKLPNEQ